MSKTKDAEVSEKYKITINLPRKLTNGILTFATVIAICIGIYYIPYIWSDYLHYTRSLWLDTITEETTPDNPIIRIRMGNEGKRFFTYEEKFYLYRYIGSEGEYDGSKYEEIVLRDDVLFSPETYSLDKGNPFMQTINLKNYIDGPYSGKYRIMKEFVEYSKEGGRKIGTLPCYFFCVIEVEQE